MFLALGGTVQERDEIGGVQWGDSSKQMVRRLVEFNGETVPNRSSGDSERPIAKAGDGTLKYTICSGI